MPYADRPRFPSPLLRRTRCTDTSSNATLWMKAQHEGALTPSCILRKKPKVPLTARLMVCYPVNNSRGKWSSLPQTRRGLTLRSQLCRDPEVGESESETERKSEIPASPRYEALFHCANLSGVLRCPANSTASLTSQRHPGKFPQVPGRSRGK